MQLNTHSYRPTCSHFAQQCSLVSRAFLVLARHPNGVHSQVTVVAEPLACQWQLGHWQWLSSLSDFNWSLRWLDLLVLTGPHGPPSLDAADCVFHASFTILRGLLQPLLGKKCQSIPSSLDVHWCPILHNNVILPIRLEAQNASVFCVCFSLLVW